MPAKKSTQTALGHIGIEVAKLKNSKKFYTALLEELGFKTIMESEDGIGFSNQAFQIWVAEMPKPRVRREAPTGEEFVVADHLAFLVPDRSLVDAIERKMKRNGYEPLFPCEEHPEFIPGYYAVSFCDPDNYVIEVYTRPQTNEF